MKKISYFSLLAIFLLSGCASHYMITLNNGNQITSRGKPKREGAAYVFKDASGKSRSVPAGNVTEIAPASMNEKKDQNFNLK
jgi:hypothetical protein